MIKDFNLSTNWSECSGCGKGIHESHPHSFLDEKKFCLECSFVLGNFTEKEYICNHGIFIDKAHAAVNPSGSVIIWVGNPIPPWLPSSRDKRCTAEYRNWRTKVFERDGYTCQKCGKKGEELNAHHIKSYSKFKRLRLNVSNGITLCELCHKEKHRRGVRLCLTSNG